MLIIMENPCANTAKNIEVQNCHHTMELSANISPRMAIRPLARRGRWAEVTDFMLDLDDVPSSSWR